MDYGPWTINHTQNHFLDSIYLPHYLCTWQQENLLPVTPLPLPGYLAKGSPSMTYC